MSIKWPIRWDLRTSESHPLQIDWISHANFKGKIGLTLCPGKYQPVSWTGGWNRDLKTDLETLVEQGTSTVITLIDKNEMESLRVNNIGVIIEQMGMRWIHLPLEDTTAPNIKNNNTITEINVLNLSMINIRAISITEAI